MAVATTAPDGRFSMTDVPRGGYRFEATDAATRGRAVASVTVDRPIADLVFRFGGRGRVFGVVLDSDGETALAAATVCLTGGTPGLSLLTSRTSTDAEGAYAFEEVPEGELRVVARHPSNGLLGAALGRLVGDGDVAVLNATIESYGSVVVYPVRTDRVTAVEESQAALRMPPFPGEPTPAPRPQTWDEGIVYEHVRLGSQALAVEELVGPDVVQRKDLTVSLDEAGERAELRVVLPGTGSVEVTVAGLDPGQAADVTVVDVHGVATDPPVQTTGDPPKATFPSIRVGPIDVAAVTVQPPHRSARTVGEVEQEAHAETVDISVGEANAVSGRVVDAGEPAPATVWLRGDAGTFTRLAADGDFE